MSRWPAALLLFVAACKSGGGTPCTTPVPSTTLYNAYCASAPNGICFLDHPTDL